MQKERKMRPFKQMVEMTGIEPVSDAGLRGLLQV